MDAATLEKYRKVLLLSHQGATDGERKAAQSILATMERRYPGIGAAATAPPPPPPGGAFGFPPQSPGATGFRPSGKAAPPKQEEGFMGGIFDFLRGAAAELREGLTLREQVIESVSVETTVNTRTARIVVSLPLYAIEELYAQFGEEKAPEIATVIASLVRAEFLSTLSPMGLDDGDE